MFFNEFYTSRMYKLFYNLKETCQDRYGSIIICFIFCFSFVNGGNSRNFAAVRENALVKAIGLVN